MEQSQRLSQLTTLAIAGQIALNASAWLLPVVSEFSLVGDNMSELVLGNFGFIQTLAFVFAGIGTIALAVAIGSLTSGRGFRVGSALVFVYGVGAIATAIFPTDRVDAPADVWSASTTGLIHVAISLVSFLSMIVGMFVLTRAFGRDPRWRSLVRPSAMLAGSALALLFVQSQGPIVGLLQRALVAMISAWMIVIAVRARAIAQGEIGAVA